jgi:sugar O-acyltransferase (sialic acid O-acetyltransferase NeuD family)
MKDIAIYGAGGFGREVACLIHIINKKTPQWNLIGFFDDDTKLKNTKNEYGKVIGGIEELNNYNQPLAVAIAIGSPKTVAKIVSNIHNKNIEFPNIISPDIVYLDENNISIGYGNIICTGCLLSCHVKIGNFNILNGFIPIGHDSVIGDYNSFMPNTKISGEVKIGNRNFFGVGSIVLQQITIGNDTVVGANSLIFRNTKDGMTYIGNPAKIMKY